MSINKSSGHLCNIVHTFMIPLLYWKNCKNKSNNNNDKVITLHTFMDFSNFVCIDIFLDHQNIYALLLN